MNLNIRTIKCSASEETKNFIDKKLQKLDFAKDYLLDLDLVIKRETVGQGFHIESQMHFKWGTIKQVSCDCYELYEGIETIVDKIESVTRKEKSKVIES